MQECENCHTEHRIILIGRLIFVSLTILPMLVYGFFLTPFDSVFATIGAGITILVFGFFFTPYLVTYKKVD